MITLNNLDPNPKKRLNWWMEHLNLRLINDLQEVMMFKGLTYGDVARGTDMKMSKVMKFFMAQDGLDMKTASKIAYFLGKKLQLNLEDAN